MVPSTTGGISLIITFLFFLRHHTTTIRLFGRLVKEFRLRRQVIGLFHQIIQLDPPFQDGINRLVENLRRFVQIFLNFGHFIRFGGVLVFLQIVRRGGKVDRFRCRDRPPGIAVLLSEFVEQLSQQDKGHPGGVFLVGGDRSAEAVAADVAVNDVTFVLDGLALAGFGALTEHLGEEEEHFFDGLCF